MSGNECEAISCDYVRVKRKHTTIFIYVTPAAETAADLKAKLHAVTKVPTTEMKLFIDKNGDVALDDSKLLSEQKVENDQELFMVYRKKDADEWEAVELTDGKPPEAGGS